MKKEFNNPNVCPCCGRHCSADNLSCSRGKAYFGQETEKDHHAKGRNELSIKDETIMLMLKCGHLLHHGLRERAEHEDILQFLSREEKNELTVLLQKCVNAWNN